MAKEYIRIPSSVAESLSRISESSIEFQLEIDKLVYGAAYYTTDSDGKKTRIDPRILIVVRDKKPTLWQRIKRFFCNLFGKPVEYLL